MVVNFEVLNLPSHTDPTSVASTITTTASGTLGATTWPILKVQGSHVEPPTPDPPTMAAFDPTGWQGPADMGSEVTLYWKKSAEEVTFAVQGTRGGWVGLGFPEGGKYQMTGADAVIAWVTGAGQTHIKPYSLTGQDVSLIKDNPKLVITNPSVSEVHGVTTMQFTRRYDTGNHPITSDTASFIAASSSSDYLIQHDTVPTQSYTIDLNTGAVSITSSRREFLPHGIMMYIAWGILLPFGMLFARYARGLGHVWFKVHMGVQIVGSLLVVAAFIVVFIINRTSHFKTPVHAQLGTALLAWLVLHILYGFLRPHHEEGEPKTKPRKFFEIIHPWSGRIILLVAVVQMILGAFEIGMRVLFIVLVAISFLIAVIAAIVLEIRKRSRESHKSQMS